MTLLWLCSAPSGLRLVPTQASKLSIVASSLSCWVTSCLRFGAGEPVTPPLLPSQRTLQLARSSSLAEAAQTDDGNQQGAEGSEQEQEAGSGDVTKEPDPDYYSNQVVKDDEAPDEDEAAADPMQNRILRFRLQEGNVSLQGTT